MAVKLVFDGDGAKLRAEYAKIVQSEKSLVAAVQALTKESEKSEKQALKEAEARKKANEATKEAVQASKQLANENAKLAKENDRLNEKITKNSKAQKTGFDDVRAGVAQAAAGYFTVASAIGLVNAALEKKKQLEEKALDSATLRSRALSQLAMNMAGASSDEFRSAVSGVDAMARRARASDSNAVFNAVSAVSSTTAGDIPQAMKAVEAAIPLSRLDSGDLPVLARASAEIGKSAGSQDYEKNLGFLLAIGGVTAQPRTADFAEHLPKALATGAATMTDQKAGMEQTAEIYATLSNLTADMQGAEPKTATAKFVSKMEQFFRAQGNDPGTIEGRIAAIQANPRLRDELMKEAVGDETFKIPIREMLTPGTRQAAMLADIQGRLDYDTSGGLYASTVENITGALPEQRVADANAAAAGVTQSMGGDPERAIVASARERLREGLEARPDAFGYIGNEIDMGMFETEALLTGDAVTAATARLESRRRYFSGEGRPNQAEWQGQGQNAETVQKLDELISEIRGLRRDQTDSGTAIPTDRN
jgi:hypothetical protein